MKRFVMSVMLLMFVFTVNSAFGDMPDPRYLRRRARELEGKLEVEVFAGGEDLMFRMEVHGEGDYSYSISNKETGEIIYSQSEKSLGEISIGRTWKYEVPEQGKEIHYEVKASFDPVRKEKTEITKNITVRNIEGVINVVIE